MELKRCPFCGGEAFLEPYKARKGYEASIQCNQCLCSMGTITYDDEEKAVEVVSEAWNRRTENEELCFTWQFIVDRGLLYELLNEWEARSDNAVD